MKLRSINNLTLKNHRGQMVFGMSFGMIFSIILIAVFIFVAIWAIWFFLDIKCQTDIGLFIEDFQEEVDEIWNSQQGERTFESSICKNVEYVCVFNADRDKKGGGISAEAYKNFKKIPGKNLFFYPKEKVDVGSVEVDHLDISDAVDKKNPYCFKVEDGKVEIPLKKDFRDRKVSIGV